MTLRQVLLSGMDDVVVFDKTFTHYTQHADGTVTAHFADGDAVTADLLVGADGAGSRVRRQYLPHAGHTETGLVAIGSKVAHERRRRRSAAARGDGRHVHDLRPPRPDGRRARHAHALERRRTARRHRRRRRGAHQRLARAALRQHHRLPVLGPVHLPQPRPAARPRPRGRAPARHRAGAHRRLGPPLARARRDLGPVGRARAEHPHLRPGPAVGAGQRHDGRRRDPHHDPGPRCRRQHRPARRPGAARPAGPGPRRRARPWPRPSGATRS